MLEVRVNLGSDCKRRDNLLAELPCTMGCHRTSCKPNGFIFSYRIDLALSCPSEQFRVLVQGRSNKYPGGIVIR